MALIKLKPEEIVRSGNYPAPDKSGYNSLFFHNLTQGYDTETYYKWGQELTAICESEGHDYYYFENDFGTKINVYPNEVIKEWWNNR